MNNKHASAAFLLILIFISLSACQTITPPPPTQTQTPTYISTTTPLPSSTPLPTLTATPEITFTPTQSPTPTSRWDDWGSSLTPLPPINEPIGLDNIEQIQMIAVWGTGRANQIKISPDGRILAVGTNIGVFLYDSQTYELVDILKTPYAVQSIAFSSDNQLMALGQIQNTVDLFERGTNVLLHRFSSPESTSTSATSASVTFSPDNTRLSRVTLTPDKIYIDSWDSNSYQPAGLFTVENDKAQFLNPEINLVGILHENSLDLQSLTSMEETYSVTLPQIDPSSFWKAFTQNEGRIIPSSDGTFLILHNGSSIIHWEILADEITYQLDEYDLDLPDPCEDVPDTCRNSQGGISWTCDDSLNTPPISTISLSPENFRVLISLKDGRSEFRHTEDGSLDWEIDATFTDLAFSPSGDTFFGIRPDGSIEKRATLDGSLINSLRQHPDQLYDLDFSPDNSILATGFNDGWIRVFSTIDGEMLGILEGTAQSLQFSPDGLRLAAGLTDGTIRVFALAEGRYDDLQPQHLDSVTAVEFSSDGQLILTGSDDCTAGLWRLTRRYRIESIPSDPEDPFRLKSVALSRDTEKRYLVGNLNGIIAVQENDTRQILSPHINGFSDLALSPDGRLLGVTGPESWLVPVPASAIQAEPRLLQSETAAQGIAIAFTPDGSVVVLANNEALQFWSADNGALLDIEAFYSAPQANSQPASLAISPDGKLIALGSHEGFITLYAVP